MTTSEQDDRIAEYERLGFDRVEREEAQDTGKVYYRVRCSQCQAMVINGHPVHEEGCPNEARSRREAELDEWEAERAEEYHAQQEDE